MLGLGSPTAANKYLHGNSSLSRPKTQPVACNTAYPTSSNTEGGGWHAQPKPKQEEKGQPLHTTSFGFVWILELDWAPVLMLCGACCNSSSLL